MILAPMGDGYSECILKDGLVDQRRLIYTVQIVMSLPKMLTHIALIVVL